MFGVPAASPPSPSPLPPPPPPPPPLPPPHDAQAPTILVFNSGLGGLTVFREVSARAAGRGFVYLADDAAFPYGDPPKPR